jgi:hypothetical protein
MLKKGSGMAFFPIFWNALKIKKTTFTRGGTTSPQE